MISSFSDVINALGGTAKFARAIGMKANTAKMAKSRDSIAPEWWMAVAAAANEAGRYDISAERLAELAAERRAA
tara:strand:+ start:671 stop:892 length:222 start_codon:yes stop_codon:yes gene_type:complete